MQIGQLTNKLFLLNVPYLFDLPPWALIKFLDLEGGSLFEVGVLILVSQF